MTSGRGWPPGSPAGRPPCRSPAGAPTSGCRSSGRSSAAPSGPTSTTSSSATSLPDRRRGRQDGRGPDHRPAGRYLGRSQRVRGDGASAGAVPARPAPPPRTRQEAKDGEGVRPRDRPGNDLDPGHALPAQRHLGRRGPGGARADLSPGRLGRARPQGDLGEDPAGDLPGPAGQQPHRRQHRRGRDHQPARDHRRLGQEHRRAGLQRHRLAGHPDPADRVPVEGRGLRGRDQAQDRAGHRHLLLGHQDRLDPGERGGGQGAGRARATCCSATPTPG